MAGRFVRVRERNQITVPPEVAERLAVRPGDILEFSFSPAGTVELRPAKIVTVGTPEALQEEEAAKEDIRRGRYSVIANVDEYLDRVRKGDYPSARPVLGMPPADIVMVARPSDSDVENDIIRAEDASEVGGMISSLTPLQALEVKRIVEETVKRYVSDASGSRSIIVDRANAAE
jgi:AbrB family looped-hinge helix DNA binding protein